MAAATHSPACDCTWVQTAAGWVRTRLGKRCAWHRGTVLDYIALALAAIEQNMEKIMTDQDTADAVAGRIEADVASESASIAAIRAEIAVLQNAHPAVDFTRLLAAVDTQDAAAADEAAVAPAPEPAPDAPAS